MTQFRHKIEHLIARVVLGALGALPRPLARAAGMALLWPATWLLGRFRRVAHRNLSIAFPELNGTERRRLIRRMYRNLGRMTAEFAHFPHLTRENISRVIVYDGFENYAEALQRGRGVLFLTGHVGAWELAAFAHSVYGHPLNVVIRALDNPLLNDLVNRYRALGGNRIIDKREFLRGFLEALKRNEAVGILMDQNSSEQEGAFVDFFGVPACTNTGIARIALRTGAAVVPGFALWDEERGRYRLRFDPPLELVRTGDERADIAANTQLFTSALERHIRRHPDQWLWIHRRWKTRPQGSPPLYE